MLVKILDTPSSFNFELLPYLCKVQLLAPYINQHVIDLTNKTKTDLKHIKSYFYNIMQQQEQQQQQQQQQQQVNKSTTFVLMSKINVINFKVP